MSGFFHIADEGLPRVVHMDVLDANRKNIYTPVAPSYSVNLRWRRLTGGSATFDVDSEEFDHATV